MSSRRIPVLATGCIKLHISADKFIFVRALFDSGSEVNLITEKCANQTKLPKRKYSIELEGITGSQWIDAGEVYAQISPWFDNKTNYKIFKSFIIMKKLPTAQRFNCPQQIDEFQHIVKADPRYYQTSGADLLLGIDTWAEIISSNIIRSKIGLVAQSTKFGYAIYGSINEQNEQTSSFVCSNITIKDESNYSLNELLRRFFEEEELNEDTILSKAEQRAEQIYKNTTYQANDGRFVVRLPLIDGNIELGDSRRIALERFYQLERRLERNPEIYEKYNATMREAIDCHRMRIATPEERQASGYYIPHHPIIKRFRVVMDGSCKTTNGKSINDIQLAGPNLQEKLAFIIMRFRFHKYVLSADIKKMFLQILLNEEDLKYHKIFWRFSKNEPLREYVLLRVTFGMKSSPYLANKTMLHIAKIYEKQYPMAAYATKQERYVDDYMTGSDTPQQVIQLYKQLKDMLSKVCFDTSKYKTNCQEMLSEINKDSNGNDQPLELNDEITSILGLNWQPNSDCFTFKIDEQYCADKIITKRTIASAVSKIYDPCGFLAPVVLTAKYFLQLVWRENVDWDVPLKKELADAWNKYYNGLKALNELKIPRWIQTTKGRDIQLIGFADASVVGYGAVIYIRCADNKSIWCNLLTSKTKVAPVKTVTIPRLELCATLLLARLMKCVREKCKLEYVPYKCYSDSNIALSWIANCPSKLKVYVASRVKEIQKCVTQESWSYIPSKQNPADICSRGIHPTELLSSQMWWNGPQFISEPIEPKSFEQPNLTSDESTACKAEFKPALVTRSGITNTSWLSINNEPLINRYSNLSKIIRITAYVQRAVNLMRRKKALSPETIGLLSTDELNSAVNYWIKYTQQKHLATELSSVINNKPLHKESKIIQLSPFIDDQQIMRLRGRLSNANITYDEKHPIIVPANSTFGKKLLHEAHIETLHGGVQLMLHYVRTRYWMIGARKAAASIAKMCGKCFRYQRADQRQLMCDIPKERLSNTRPFVHCGIDYFGPIQIKRFEGRCKTIEKGYGAVFVCMTTKMVHIECVSNLSTDRFLWALSRFSAIYQLPQVIMSDNAKTFKGAKRELENVLKTWKSPDVENFITAKGIKWKFITPRAPSHGGLWEAAVKSAKHHAKRILSGHILTFERYQTLFSKIAAVLNSRPLVTLTDDPSELNYLTPSHAVIGEKVIQPICQNLSSIPINRITQHKLLDKIQQDFWQAWRKDYISTLQTRYKWNTVQENLKVNDLVLLKVDNIAPCVWPMARVIETYPGADGMVRSVKIRTPKNDLIRPITKLVKMPIQEPLNEDMSEQCDPTRAIQSN